MKLVRARVTDFKSIDDSGWVDIDDVTSMVGKNESGKTAFLGALKRLNPVDGDQEFELKDYPRKGYVKYRRQHKTDPAVAITAVMTLSDDEKYEMAEQVGGGRYRIRRDYGLQELQERIRLAVRHGRKRSRAALARKLRAAAGNRQPRRRRIVRHGTAQHAGSARCEAGRRRQADYQHLQPIQRA